MTPFSKLAVEQGSSSLTVSPERGGIVTSLILDGVPIVYMDEESFEDPSRSVRGGIPILFPICGPLPEDRWTHDGVTYRMKQHGFARTLPWNVADHDPASHVTLELADTPESLAQYPFAFRLRFSYHLRPSMLRIEQEFQNLAEEPMPMSSGLHPYFLTPDKGRVQVEAPASRWAPNPYGQTTFFEEVDLAHDDPIDYCFTDMISANASLVDRSQQHRIRVRSHADHRFYALWTQKDKPFCCLEPWTARPNALNRGQALLKVPPGDTHRLWVEISREAL